MRAAGAGLIAWCCALALTARATSAAPTLWERATRSADAELAARTYDEAMQAGDDAVALAVAADVLQLRARLVAQALRYYEAASAARPDAVDPHIRAGAVIQSFLLECRRGWAALCGPNLDHASALRAIEHWDALERLAPLDPRLTDEVLFDRAILHTKLGTPEHLALAGVDYQRLLDRLQGLAPVDPISAGTTRRAQVLGNQAETFMMLGDLDRAIEVYRRAERLSPELTRAFGLAVALDRDDQPAAAREVVRAQGRTAFGEFVEALMTGAVFFVPEGEVAYYLGLGAEFNGDLVGAIEHFEEFIRSGAHPRYQRRAREHLVSLRAQLARGSVRGTP